MIDVKEKDIVVFNDLATAVRFEVVAVGEKPQSGGAYLIEVREQGTRFATQIVYNAMVKAVVTR